MSNDKTPAPLSLRERAKAILEAAKAKPIANAHKVFLTEAHASLAQPGSTIRRQTDEGVSKTYKPLPEQMLAFLGAETLESAAAILNDVPGKVSGKRDFGPETFSVKSPTVVASSLAEIN